MDKHVAKYKESPRELRYLQSQVLQGRSTREPGGGRRNLVNFVGQFGRYAVRGSQYAGRGRGELGAGVFSCMWHVHAHDTESPKKRGGTLQ